LTVLPTPQHDDRIEISLIFTSSSGIGVSFAEEMFEDLVNTSIQFSANPNGPLPMPDELCAMEVKVLDKEEKHK
jgi:hypothetical protein